MSPTSRFLRVAEFLFGPERTSLVFEPLLADRARDLEANPSLVHRARWWSALALTSLQTIPSAALRGIPLALSVNLAGRAVAFFALGLALQWFLGARLGPRSGAAAWPPSLETTLLFMVIPVTLRIRASALPVHQQRLLTLAFSLACLVATVATSVHGWLVSAAFVVSFMVLAGYSWRLAMVGTGAWRAAGPPAFWRGFYSACGLILAITPLKLALGIRLVDAYWPGDNLIPYLIGIMIGLSTNTGPVRQSNP